MMTSFRNLVRSDKGNSLVEMGLVAPVLATLLIGMVDLSRAYSAKLQLVQAAQRTIEQVMQQSSVESDYSAALKTEGATAAGVAESAVAADNWLECSVDGITWTRQASFGGSCDAATPMYARYVTVDISKSYTPLFSSRFFPGASSNGTYTLHGKAGIRVQ